MVPEPMTLPGGSPETPTDTYVSMSTGFVAMSMMPSGL